MAPIIVGLLLKKMGFRTGLILLGVVAVVSVFMGAFAEMHPPSEVPSDLNVAATTDTRVDLAWKDNSEREDNVIIERIDNDDP